MRRPLTLLLLAHLACAVAGCGRAGPPLRRQPAVAAPEATAAPAPAEADEKRKPAHPEQGP